MFERIPHDTCLELGAEDDDVGPDGLGPCELLCAILGPTTGQDRWLSLLGRATRLGASQATLGEIASALAVEHDLSPDLAHAITAACEGAIETAATAARAVLRERLWDLATGATKGTKDDHTAAQAAARQYLGWQGGPDAAAIREAIREVEGERGIRGRRGRPVG
jgi:hypothetical protein